MFVTISPTDEARTEHAVLELFYKVLILCLDLRNNLVTLNFDHFRCEVDIFTVKHPGCLFTRLKLTAYIQSQTRVTKGMTINVIAKHAMPRSAYYWPTKPSS